MGRKKSLIKQSAVARATRGLLAGAAGAAGLAGDIEVQVDLETAVVKLHIKRKSETAVASAEAGTEINEWDSVL